MKELVFHRSFLPAVERWADRVGFHDGEYHATFAEHGERVLRLADADQVAVIGIPLPQRTHTTVGRSQAAQTRGKHSGHNRAERAGQPLSAR